MRINYFFIICACVTLSLVALQGKTANAEEITVLPEKLPYTAPEAPVYASINLGSTFSFGQKYAQAATFEAGIGYRFPDSKASISGEFGYVSGAFRTLFINGGYIPYNLLFSDFDVNFQGSLGIGVLSASGNTQGKALVDIPQLVAIQAKAKAIFNVYEGGWERFNPFVSLKHVLVSGAGSYEAIEVGCNINFYS